MRFLYLLEFEDEIDRSLKFSLVVEGTDPADAVLVAGVRLVAQNNLPAEGDYFAVDVHLLLRTSGVYATTDAGRYTVTRAGGAPVVEPAPRRVRTNQPRSTA